MLFVLASCHKQAHIVRSTDTNDHPVRIKHLNHRDGFKQLSPNEAVDSVFEASQMDQRILPEVCSRSMALEHAALNDDRFLHSMSAKKALPLIDELRSFHPKKNDIRKLSGASREKPVHWASVLSLVMGILGFFVIPLLGSIAAIVFGIIALNKINAEDSNFSGQGLAIAGLILGVVGLLLLFLFVGIILAAL